MSEPRVGLTTGCLSASWTLDQVLEWAARIGLRCLELDTGAPFTRRPVGIVDVRAMLAESGVSRKVAERARALDVPIVGLFYYGANAMDPDPERRRVVVGGLVDALRLASELGAGYVITGAGSPNAPAATGRPWHTSPFGMPPNETEVAARVQVFADVFGPIADQAARLGVRIGFEPSPWGGGVGSVGCSPASFERLFAAVPSMALGVCMDPSHLLWQQIDYVAFARELCSTGRLVCMQAKDNEILHDRLARVGLPGDGWWRHRLPGHGQVRWEALFTALLAGGYAGPVTIEHEDQFFGYRGADPLDDGALELTLRGVESSAEFLRSTIRIAAQNR